MIEKSSPISEQYGHTLEERRENILGNLEVKIKAVTDLRNLIKSFKIEISSEEIENGLNSYRKELESNFSPETIKSAKEYNKIQERIEELNRILYDDNVYEIEISEEEEFRYIDELEKLYEERGEIDLDEDALFLTNVLNSINSLIEANKKVNYFKGNRGALNETIDQAVPFFKGFEDGELEQFDLKEIKKIIYKPFFVCVVLNKEYSSKVLRGEGMLTGGTSIAFINDRGQENRDTIQHEYIHAVTEGVLSLKSISPDILLRPLQHFKENEGILDENKYESRKKYLLSLGTDDFIDGIQNELIAELDVARRICFEDTERKRSLEELVLMANFGYRDKNDRFESYAGTLSTAGNSIKRAVAYLHEAASSISDLEIRQHCLYLANRIKSKFIKTIEQVKAYSNVSKKLEKNAYADVNSLLYLLPPSRYRHIGVYLKNKYGKKVDRLLEKEFYENK